MELKDNINEILYRNIRIDDICWDCEFNRPSPSAFKDKNGLSVEKLANRNENEIIKNLNVRFHRDKKKAIVKISVKKCLDIKLYPVDKPTKKNKFHAEIHNGPNNDKLIDDDKCLCLYESVIFAKVFK